MVFLCYVFLEVDGILVEFSTITEELVKQTFEKIGKVRHGTFKVDSLVDFKEDLTSWILAEIVFIKKSDIYHAHRWCDKIYLDGGAIVTSRRQIQDYKNHKRNVYVAVRKQFMQ